MAISRIIIENFKGIDARTDIKLKPLNIFIGPNSSGKSTCIHALAALSQTVKLPNNFRSLLLDDEFAYVHLGRFIEVVHSRTYDRAMKLGLECDDVRLFRRDAGNKRSLETASGCGVYSFKSTRRTQGIYLEGSEHEIAGYRFRGEKKGSIYRLENLNTSMSIRMALRGAFSYEDALTFPGGASVSVARAESFSDFMQLQRSIRNNLANVNYLGPFRQSPRRRYPTRGSSPREVGAEGEATITLLANEAVQSTTRKHIGQVNGWLKLLGLGNKIDVTRVASSDLFDVSIELSGGTRRFPLADLGYGVSQVLPVLVQCSFASEGATLLFEQPEIHLHTVAARNLVKVFIDTVKKKKVTILAETHSPDLVHQIQCEIREGTISQADVAIFRVTRSNGCSSITELAIDVDASIYANWEKGLSTE